jgi:hypothetical protein
MTKSMSSKIRFLGVIGFLLFIGHYSLCIADSKVVCNEFNLIAEGTGKQISFQLETDLPSDTTVMVRVSRLYWREGLGEAYYESYFEKRTSVRELKKPIRVLIDDTIWKNEIEKKQKLSSLIGEPLRVKKISDDILINLVVPINQSNPKFGKGNINLEGPFVSKEGLRIIRAERIFNIPLSKQISSGIIKKKQYSLDPNNLEVNLLYRISKRTPLPQELKPKDPLKAIAEMRYLPPGSVFRILRVHQDKDSIIPYYYVRADVHGAPGQKVTGWIYGTALMGQDLSVVD